MKVKQQKGLTLIEVLVVTSILALVTLAVFKVFNTDVNRAKDAKRKSDLREIKLSLEDYYNDHQTYPPENFLLECGGSSLQPYLKSVPCDPVMGTPYLYLPHPGNGDNSKGYRILSILDDHADPVIEELGCQDGCGIPEDNTQIENTSKYVYGVAEGVSLVVKPNAPTPIPTVDRDYCDSNLCYCCAYSAHTSNQDCNVWEQGNNCDIGPYASANHCYSETPCVPQKF